MASKDSTSFDAGTTHFEGCYNIGRKHYECSLVEIERLRSAARRVVDAFAPPQYADAATWSERREALQLLAAALGGTYESES